MPQVTTTQDYLQMVRVEECIKNSIIGLYSLQPANQKPQEKYLQSTQGEQSLRVGKSSMRSLPNPIRRHEPLNGRVTKEKMGMN